MKRMQSYDDWQLFSISAMKMMLHNMCVFSSQRTSEWTTCLLNCPTLYILFPVTFTIAHNIPTYCPPCCWSSAPPPSELPLVRHRLHQLEEVQSTPIRRTNISFCTKGQTNLQKASFQLGWRLTPRSEVISATKYPDKQRLENQRVNKSQGTKYSPTKDKFRNQGLPLINTNPDF